MRTLPDGRRAGPAAGFGLVDVDRCRDLSWGRILFVLVLLLLAAEGLVRSRVGRAWMAIRGMDVAAETIGIRPLRTNLLARLRDRPLVPVINAKGGIESGGADDLKIAPFTLHISTGGEFGTDRRWQWRWQWVMTLGKSSAAGAPG